MEVDIVSYLRVSFGIGGRSNLGQPRSLPHSKDLRKTHRQVILEDLCIVQEQDFPQSAGGRRRASAGTSVVAVLEGGFPLGSSYRTHQIATWPRQSSCADVPRSKTLCLYNCFGCIG